MQAQLYGGGGDAISVTADAELAMVHGVWCHVARQQCRN